MKLFLTILLSSLFIAPLMHSMYCCERQQMHSGIEFMRTVPAVIKGEKDRLDQFKKQLIATDGNGLSVEERLLALHSTIFLKDTVLAEQIINRCRPDELDLTIGCPVCYETLTPLQYAAKYSNKRIVSLLLAAKVDVNCTYKTDSRSSHKNDTTDGRDHCTQQFCDCALRSNSALFYAMGCGRVDVDMVELLLDAGATAFLPSAKGFFAALVDKKTHCIFECFVARNLIPKEFASDPRVIQAQTMQERLNKAVQEDNFAEVINCLKQDAYQSSTTKQYIFQKLAVLVKQDDLVSLRRLIIQGFPLFICDKQGNTLLHVAAKAGSVHTIGYFIALLKKLGKLDQYAFKRNQAGKTAIDDVVASPDLLKLFIGLENSKLELDLNLPVDALQLPGSVSNSNGTGSIIA